MEQFVNRRDEIGLINSAFNDLLDKEQLLLTPIIDFYGVEGIGKSSILKEARKKCVERNVRCVDANISQGFVEFWQKIRSHSHKYSHSLLQDENRELLVTQSTEIVKELLEEEPLVMLLDAVDEINESQIEYLEKFLAELVFYNNLFIILASRRMISFERKKLVARQLTTIPIFPLAQDDCQIYLKNTGHTFSEEKRDLILEWTLGYPLAMHVMVEALSRPGIDASSEQGQEQLINLIVERVIDQGILINASKDERPRYRELLSLLAVPRRFNVLLMQQLIEEFTPQFKLSRDLAYILLSREITRVTGVLSWDLTKAGLAVDDSIRNILLLQLKITHPERYAEINHFLAEANRQNAASDEIRGSDRIHYQREYLYHSALNTADDHLAAFLQTTIEQMIQIVAADSEQLVQFREEFSQDHELQKVLGKHAAIVVPLLDQALTQKMNDVTAEG